MQSRKTLVYISDLTHTYQTVALNAMPYAVACIVSYAKTYLKSPDQFEFRIFKYPAKLLLAIEKKMPDIACFSNYMWNIDLSTQIAKLVKQKNPQAITIFGGPNYPTDAGEQEQFLREYPVIDFHVYKEGEIAFTELLQKLADNNFDAETTKKETLRSCHFLKNDVFTAGPIIDRIKNLDEIPSPYLTGLLDEFFDEYLVPVEQSNRGCPFQCTFCVEGLSYYTKVAPRSPKLIREELIYIAQHKKPTVHDLHIVDSNFGMYKDDEEIADYIADVQEQYGWPQHIHVATGKNQKERVLKVARTIKGALRIAAALQSLDDAVLGNIKRKNLGTEKLMEFGKEVQKVGGNDYAEFILALPGETRASHFKTIETIIEAKFKIIGVYNLMMLPGTEMSEKPVRAQYEMRTKYRVIPRCFGIYPVANEPPIVSAELEEICYETKDLSFSEYVECRLLHLTLAIFYNDSMCMELLEFLSLCNISLYEWLMRIHQKRKVLPKVLQDIYDAFEKETKEELWDSKNMLTNFVRNEQNLERFASGELGSNLLYKYKALAFTQALPDLLNVVFEEARALVQEKIPDTLLHYDQYLTELLRYSLLQKENFLEPTLITGGAFTYDFVALKKEHFQVLPDVFKFKNGSSMTVIQFAHSASEQKLIEDALSLYGNDIVGISRIFSKFAITKMYREPRLV